MESAGLEFTWQRPHGGKGSPQIKKTQLWAGYSHHAACLEREVHAGEGGLQLWRPTKEFKICSVSRREPRGFGVGES